MVEGRRRAALVADIAQAGGFVTFSRSRAGSAGVSALVESLGISTSGSQRCDLMLRGEQFSDEWLDRHGQLRGLPVNNVIVVKAPLTTEGLCRLAEAHAIDTLTVPGMPLTDADLERIARRNTLRFLNLNRTDLTDAALRMLQPDQLGSLYVGKTHITAEALSVLREAPRLQALGLDGRQFTLAISEMMAALPRLQSLVLIGPEITDEHLAQVARLPRIKVVLLERTAVTPVGIAAFQQQCPDCRLQMPTPGNEVIPW
jgi:hypothetical protein